MGALMGVARVLLSVLSWWAFTQDLERDRGSK
jgi:hypothetical protein